MAHCTQNPQDFILNAFPVMIGSLVSEDAESLCQKNNLSFVELIRPFCQLNTDAQIHDPINPSVVVPVRRWKLRVVNIQASPPPPMLVTKILSEVVNKTIPPIDVYRHQSPENQNNASTPWFEAYRDCFFQLIQPMKHEFLRDFLACLLVVSTKHPDPMHAFAALSSRQNNIQNATDRPANSFRWFNQNTFKYYVLLHDVSDSDDSKAEKTFLSMKSVYGSHTCFLLQINSRQKMHAENGEDTTYDSWSSHIYPFEDNTLDIDENELDNEPITPSTPAVVNPSDLDRKEQQIVNELESIEKEIAEHPDCPTRSMSFNDPLTSMHYDTLDTAGEDEITNTSKPPVKEHTRHPRKLSERSKKLDGYRKSLQQFSYHLVSTLGSDNKRSTQGTQSPSRKEKGLCMTLLDQEKIKNFIHEFAVRGLLPHIEKLMRNLSEQILNRRGIHKSIFNVTKKWFGGGKTQAGVGAGLTAGSSYTPESPELQHRKLGDLSFLVQHYELAYNSYHSAKREFNNDHAWLYFAGSLEMAAISAFLQANSKNYPIHYFDACISTYLNTCRLPEFATRACLLSTETLKAKNRFSEAAVEFIRPTNEESDLRSALLLEQTSHCYLRGSPCMVRKYAFHMILAGHRYSKAAQRKHTLRCYVNALQVYRDKGWYLAEDHVNFIIGRQSFNLGNLEDSYHALRNLLVYESHQPPSQQASHLREFLAVFKQNLESQRASKASDTLPSLPLPNIKTQSTRCLTYFRDPMTPSTPSSTPITNLPHLNKRSRTVNAGEYTFQKNYSKSYLQKWASMERKIVQHVTGDLPYPFKPFTPCLSSNTPNLTPAVISAGEQIAYEVVFTNPLKIPLNLLDLTLLYEFTPETNGGDENPPTPVMNKGNELSDVIQNKTIKNFQLKPSEEKPACLPITVNMPGTLVVIGVKYTLSSIGVTNSLNEPIGTEFTERQESALRTVGVNGFQEIQVKGARLNKTKKEKSTVVYDVDKRMETKVLKELPLLEVTMHNLPVNLLCGEVQEASFSFKNIGKVPIKNLHLMCNCPQAFSFRGTNTKWETILSEDGTQKIRIEKQSSKNCSDIIKIPLTNNINDDCTEASDTLNINESVTIPVSIFGLTTPGVHEIYFLFYYEPAQSSCKYIPYRLVQQLIRMQTLSTINISTSTQTSMKTTQNKQHPTDLVAQEQQHIFSMAIENRAQGSVNLRCIEFTLKKMICYSSRLKVDSLVHLPQETYLLRPGETCCLYLKTNSVKSNSQDIIISGIPLDQSQEESKNSELSLDVFLQSERNRNAIQSAFALVLHWETFFIDESFTRNVINGQSHVVFPVASSQQKNTPASTTIPPIIRSPTDGVRLTYDYNSFVKHNFAKSSACVVPITLHCSNSTLEDIQIEIEAVDGNETENGSMVTIESSLSQTLWCGHRRRVVAVKSQSTTPVKLDLLTTKGLYEIQNLNAWLIKTLKDGTSEKMKIRLPESHYVCVA